MTGSAHADDILITADMVEGRAYADRFSDSQRYATIMPGRLVGRRSRVAWYTGRATAAPGFGDVMRELTISARQGNGRVQHIADWQPEQPTLVEQIVALKTSSPTLDSLGYGESGESGYAAAIDDVLALIYNAQTNKEVAS